MMTIAGKAKPYKLVGVAKDHEWILANREMLNSYLIDDMRDHGYIPVLDASPGLNYSFNKKTQLFDYTIEASAYRVGKEKAKHFMGIILSQAIALSQDGQEVSIVKV